MAAPLYPKKWDFRRLYNAMQHDEYDLRRPSVSRLPLQAGSTYRSTPPPDIFTTSALKRTLAPNDSWLLRDHSEGAL